MQQAAMLLAEPYEIFGVGSRLLCFNMLFANVMYIRVNCISNCIVNVPEMILD